MELYLKSQLVNALSMTIELIVMLNILNPFQGIDCN